MRMAVQCGWRFYPQQRHMTLGIDAFLNPTFGGDGADIPEPMKLTPVGMGRFGLDLVTLRHKVKVRASPFQ